MEVFMQKAFYLGFTIPVMSYFIGLPLGIAVSAIRRL